MLLLGGTAEWTEKDRKLVVAFTQYEKGMCSCGYPIHICHHPENDGYFDVHETRCYAEAAIEEHRNREDYQPETGERLGAVYTREANDPLPVAFAGGGPSNGGNEEQHQSGD